MGAARWPAAVARARNGPVADVNDRIAAVIVRVSCRIATCSATAALIEDVAACTVCESVIRGVVDQRVRTCCASRNTALMVKRPASATPARLLLKLLSVTALPAGGNPTPAKPNAKNPSIADL